MSELWILLLCNLLVTPPAQSLPFLNPSAITTFFSEASSASATPDTNSNIQDFTKQAHEPKKLQVDLEQTSSQASSPGPSDQNEVLPSIVQKKIGKIIRKIYRITQFTSGNSGAGSNGGGGVMEDFDHIFNDDDDDGDDEGEGMAQTTVKSEGGEENDKKGEVEEITVSTVTTAKPSNYAVTPSSIAVFFMELVGTVMGLFYGAAAQIGQGVQPK